MRPTATIGNRIASRVGAGGWQPQGQTDDGRRATTPLHYGGRIRMGRVANLRGKISKLRPRRCRRDRTSSSPCSRRAAPWSCRQRARRAPRRCVPRSSRRRRPSSRRCRPPFASSKSRRPRARTSSRPSRTRRGRVRPRRRERRSRSTSRARPVVFTWAPSPFSQGAQVPGRRGRHGQERAAGRPLDEATRSAPSSGAGRPDVRALVFIGGAYVGGRRRVAAPRRRASRPRVQGQRGPCSRTRGAVKNEPNLVCPVDGRLVGGPPRGPRARGAARRGDGVVRASPRVCSGSTRPSSRGSAF